MTHRFRHFYWQVGFFCLIAFLSSVAPAKEITVAGQVLNKTTNSPILGAKVELVRPDGKEGGGSVLATTQSGNGGAFAFDKQEVADDDLLIGRVKWQDYSYETPVFDGSGRLQQLNLKADPNDTTIEVFNTTTEPPDLQYLVHHVAISSSDKGLKCIERIVVENPSNQTFIGLGPRQTSILLNLPKGARDVKLDPKITDATLVKTKEGYGISKAITPSSYSKRNAVIVDYMMDWPSVLPWQREIDLSRPIGYPTFFFFVAREPADQDLQIVAPKLGKDTVAPLPIDGQQEQRIINAIGAPSGAPMAGGAGGETSSSDHALEPGDEMKIAVRRPVPAMFWGFLALFGCILLFLPLALIGARRRSADEDEYYSDEEQSEWADGEPASASSVIAGTSFAEVPVSPADPQRVRMLANDIARLEEAWEAGQVEDDEYEALRAEKKIVLVRLLAGQ